MKIKSLVSILAAVGITVSSMSAFALSPSEYDGQTYESVGYTSEDPDGEINLAVIAASDVTLGNTMYIEGSVYSNGTISVIDGAGNTVDGLFISGTGDTTYTGATGEYTAVGYKIVDSNGTDETTTMYDSKPNYNGAIYDTDTSFECVYTDYEVPEIDNTTAKQPTSYWTWDAENGSYQVTELADVDVSGSISATEYAPITVAEDTHFGTLAISNDGFIIDATDGPINIVIDNFNMYGAGGDGYWTVLGDNEVNVYINNIVRYGENSDTIKLYTQNAEGAIDAINDVTWDYFSFGSDFDAKKEQIEQASGGTNINFYLDCDDSFDTISIQGSFANADIITGKSLTTSSTTAIIGDFTVGGDFSLSASTVVWGTVCAPNSTTFIGQSAVLYGQLHTYDLNMSGAGAIIYQSDSVLAKAEETPASETTDEPEATTEPTEAPDLPSGSEIDLYGLGYAYIFGYEPGEADEDGYTPIYMGPDDDVTREQVASMLMRMIDQKNGSTSESYDLTDNIAKHADTWYVRGLAYLASKGAFDGIDSVEVGSVTRGEVAKLVVYGLNLSDTEETAFTDIEDSEYKPYIEIMAAYGYMNGVSDTEFQPDRVMTRAEFCKLFNNIIGREYMALKTEDGEEITPETYSIVDISGHWAEETMLKATSAYDDDGYVDLELRQENIRNKLDNYDGQTNY
ncbi:MAG: S-layer homology domain-containing protein [Firmicutes bacterium]|nr:S-layer homology domain-containing protein [Bacillota bacterium]